MSHRRKRRSANRSFQNNLTLKSMFFQKKKFTFFYRKLVRNFMVLLSKFKFSSFWPCQMVFRRPIWISRAKWSIFCILCSNVVNLMRFFFDFLMEKQKVHYRNFIRIARIAQNVHNMRNDHTWLITRTSTLKTL